MTDHAIGDPVSKVGGDYKFDGHVRAVFTKASGQIRIVVEDDRGVLFIARQEQYALRIVPVQSIETHHVRVAEYVEDRP